MSDQSAQPADTGRDERASRKQRQGTVVSDVQDKTIVVTDTYQRTHPLYDKRTLHTRKFRVHDERNEAQVGDVVRIVETRPISKTKRWRLAEIVEKAK